MTIFGYEKAWQVAEQKGWPETVSGADQQALFTALGRAYELAEDWPKARATYQMMIDYAQAMEANTVECLALNYLATVYLNGFHDNPQALALLEQAKTVAEQNSDRRGLAETELRLANVGGNAGKPSLARHHGEKALAIARELEHHQLLARCLNMLAYAYAQTLQSEKSVESAMEAQQLYATAGSLVLAADSQRIAGWSLIFSGRPQESLLTLQETLAFSQQIENLWGEAECVRMLARTHLELGNYGQAIRMARQAVKQTRRVGHSYMRVLALIDRGTVQRTIMAWDSAQETLLQTFGASFTS